VTCSYHETSPQNYWTTQISSFRTFGHKCWYPYRTKAYTEEFCNRVILKSGWNLQSEKLSTLILKFGWAFWLKSQKTIFGCFLPLSLSSHISLSCSLTQISPCVRSFYLLSHSQLCPHLTDSQVMFLLIIFVFSIPPNKKLRFCSFRVKCRRIFSNSSSLSTH
jgi:hypothetical protein